MMTRLFYLFVNAPGPCSGVFLSNITLGISLESLVEFYIPALEPYRL